MPFPDNDEVPSRLDESDNKDQLSDVEKSVSKQTISDEYITEELDTSLFDLPKIKDIELNLSATNRMSLDKPSLPTNVCKLRKFKGHRKRADSGTIKKDIPMSLDDRVDYFKNRLKMGETEEQIALNIALKEKLDEESNEKPEPEQKVYSPNRSFMDLLDDSERRKGLHSRADLELNWNAKSNVSQYEVYEKKANFKTSSIGVLAIVALGIGAVIFIYLSMQPDKATEKVVSIENPSVNSLIKVEDPDQTRNELKIVLLQLLREYHEATNFNLKASFCRFPNRTIADMKVGHYEDSELYTVVGVKLADSAIIKSGVQFTLAKVELELDGATKTKMAYFTEDSEGNMKLDWHSYVLFEASVWENYLTSKSKTSTDWHLTVNLNGDLHPDYEEEKYVALTVKSWNPNAFDSTNAMLSKNDPMYEQLVEAYQAGQRNFILKVHHLGDIANTLIVDEIVSASEFYVDDIAADTE